MKLQLLLSPLLLLVAVQAAPANYRLVNGKKVQLSDGSSNSAVLNLAAGDSEDQTPLSRFPATVDVFVRSYSNDAPWFEYLARSFRRYGGLFRQMVVLVPEQDVHTFEKILKQVGVTNSRVFGKKEVLAKGYDEQQMDKLMVDMYSDAKYFCLLDSDTILSHTVELEDFFHDGKPKQVYRKREDCGLPCTTWMTNVDKMMGPVDTDNEYMVKIGQVYPREAFIWVRQAVQHRWGQTLEAYCRNQSTHTQHLTLSHTGAYVSEFEALGAIMYNQHHDVAEWCNPYEDAKCIDWEHNAVLQGWSHGDARQTAAKQELFECVITKGDQHPKCVLIREHYNKLFKDYDNKNFLVLSDFLN